MNYYDEIIRQIQELIDNGEYDEAKRLIQNELSISYVPRDVDEKLRELFRAINVSAHEYKPLNDETIEEYLYKDDNYQLIAVSELDKKNLRDYIDLCEDYLLSDGFENAKALLIDSLIRQEVNYEFEYKDSSFNPSKITKVGESEGFLSALEAIQDKFMKNPSMSQLAIELLYKEVLMALPKTYNRQEGIELADKIEKYIIDAFESAN